MHVDEQYRIRDLNPAPLERIEIKPPIFDRDQLEAARAYALGICEDGTGSSHEQDLARAVLHLSNVLSLAFDGLKQQEKERG